MKEKFYYSGGINFADLPIGTVELGIEPIKKEVVKEIPLFIPKFTLEAGTHTLRVDVQVGAYDAKLVYKIRE